MNIKSTIMKEEDLKRLIEKYYEGMSTEEDEKVLRAYFTGIDVLPGYEAEKQIFGYFMDLTAVPEPAEDLSARIESALDYSHENRRGSGLRKILVPLISAAAGLLILTGSWFFFVHRTETTDTYTNPEIAYAETMRILYDVSSQLNRGAGTLHPVGMINKMRVKSLEPISKSAGLIEKNLMNLEYLKNMDSSENASQKTGK